MDEYKAHFESGAVPIIFCETRKLAQEWTYRFLAAAAVAAEHETGGAAALGDLAPAEPLAPAPPTPKEVRAWAREAGLDVSDRGRVKVELVTAYLQAHGRA